MTTKTIMSIEQKAKAYDEALEKARKRVTAEPQDHTDAILKDIFPQLCESENERIRTAILEFFKLQDDNTTYSFIPKKSILAWLEKQGEQEQPQEELVHQLNGLMQEYVKEGKDDAEKEHRFKCYRLFWDALEDADFFEQKEPDGTWTEEDDAKVKAMCKEGDLKPSEIAWLKELKNRIVQKVAETPQWMIDFLNDIRTASINKEGYDDYDGRREYEGKILAIIKWLEGNFIQQKEQKPTIESKRLANEDEKIHKAIIEFFESQPDNTTYSFVSKRDILAYLKKQKEQKPRIINQDEKEFLANEITSFLRNYDKESDGEDPATSDVAEYFYLLGKQAQKPAEWSEEDKAIVTCIVCCLDGQFVTEAARKQCLEWFNKHRRDFLNQSKQEWSEEDERMRIKILEALSAYADHVQYTGFCANSELIRGELMGWLKSLRPQPKKELSIEKAIKWLDDTFYFLDNSSGRGRDCEITTHDFDSLEEMYDSFRKAVIVDSEPHWKPTEEQKPEAKRTRWVARDENGEIYAYEDYPEKDSEMWIGSNSMILDRKSFPDLKWEDEPVEVEITIKKKNAEL